MLGGTTGAGGTTPPPAPPTGHWHQDDDGVWFIDHVANSFYVGFTDDEIADWPPLVALRNDNARLRQAIERHRQLMDDTANEWDRLLWATLKDDE